MDTNLTSHAQLAVQIYPTCVGLWFLPNLPPKPTPTFCKIPPVYLWLPLALSRCEQAFDVFTGFTGGQFSSSPEILTRSEVCWAVCTFFFFSSFLFRVYRAAVNIFLIFFTFIECSRDFDTERSMRGHNAHFLCNRLSLQFDRNHVF